MPISTSDIQVFYASGGSLTGQAGSRTLAAGGGTISTTQVTDNTLNNLFADVTGDQAAAGATFYCKIFFKNNHSTLTWQNVKAWISSATPGTDNEISIALETTTNDTVAPVSGNFLAANSTKSSGLNPGGSGIAAGTAVGIWVRWVINNGASARASEAGTIRLEGDTAA